jgi:hypothetical protein
VRETNDHSILLLSKAISKSNQQKSLALALSAVVPLKQLWMAVLVVLSIPSF